jgi:PhnB protein
MSKSHIPRDLRTLTPSLNLRGAAKALAFYQAAFNAVPRFHMPNPDGTVSHGEFQIGDCVLMYCDEAPDWGALSPQAVGGCPLSLNLYLPDCDAATAQAVAAGAVMLVPPTTQAWGERSAMVIDPFGYRWGICTHLEDVAPEEIARRLASGWTAP